MTTPKCLTVWRVENGWIIETERDISNDRPGMRFVFNDMGYSSSARDFQSVDETLLGFIANYLAADSK